MAHQRNVSQIISPVNEAMNLIGNSRAVVFKGAASIEKRLQPTSHPCRRQSIAC